MQGMQNYHISFGNVEGETADIDIDTKPKVEKKTMTKKKKPKGESESDDDTFDNKLEDNPAQVNIIIIYMHFLP